MIDVSVGLAGFFRMVAVDAETGQERLLADWFPNMILDSGLELMGPTAVTQVCDSCQVGTSSAAVNAAQTGLVSFLAGSTSVQETTQGGVGTPDYYAWSRRRFRFGAGAAAGNLSEVAVAPAATGATFNRALIVDGLGNPTTITVLASEFLDVTYELRCYPPTADIPGVINISGQAYDLVIRAASAGTGGGWAPFDATTVNAAPYNGALGALTATPSGTSGTAVSGTLAPYSSNSKALDRTSPWSLSQANLSGGISAVATMRDSRIPVRFQIGFTPAIPKDATNQLSLTIRVSWARRTL